MTVKISVCVITYNHEKYIEECLNSILNQQCDFPFEVVIRDDCSTDNTSGILKVYADKYPEVIKVLTSEKNIGANNNLNAVFQASTGKYIALCEGDDYWIDDEKLDKQVHVMEAAPFPSFTVHECFLHTEDGLSKSEQLLTNHSNQAFTCNEVLSVAGQFAATASYMFKRDLVTQLPSWFGDAPVGDFFLEMYMAAQGKCFYLSEAMSAYRVDSSGSWSSSHNSSNCPKLIPHYKKMIFFLDDMRRKKEFEDYDFSPKISACHFNLALCALQMKEYGLFSKSICSSWSFSKHVSNTQRLLYMLNRLPRLAGMMMFVKKISWRK